MSNQIAVMAERLSIEPEELNSIVKSTVMPAKVQVSNEQFVSFMAVANEYKLNPLVKEIYAFPAKGGGIQPVVGIDGWIRIAQNHPDFNGMAHDYEMDSKGKLVSVTCKVFRKSMDYPIEATEFMAECARPTDPWKNWPNRMLKHKATIQAIRYAFGISGIVDQDEAERVHDQVERDITPKTSLIIEATQEVNQTDIFHECCDGIEKASHPGELQNIFADGWKALQQAGAKKTDQIMVDLKSIYDERKEFLANQEVEHD